MVKKDRGWKCGHWRRFERLSLWQCVMTADLWGVFYVFQGENGSEGEPGVQGSQGLPVSRHTLPVLRNRLNLPVLGCLFTEIEIDVINCSLRIKLGVTYMMS